MAVRISKPAMNLRERLKELDFKKGLVGLKIVKSDTEAEARDALNLEDHLFEDFESTGIDDNATATTLVISDTSTEVSGTLNVDSGTLFVDSANNRVGVGTSSPDATLHVEGNELKLERSDGGDAAFSFQTFFSGSPRGALIKSVSNNLILDSGPSELSSGGVTSIQFDIEGSEAARIDSSGNLLVGTTSSDPAFFAEEGVAIKSGGFITLNRADLRALRVGRNGTDGEIVEFRKDGSVVGSIGVEGDLLWMSSENGAGFRLVNDDLRPGTNEGINNDNSLDLGDSNARWKDLYLSGGVYLGGTGSANKLEDYEEGTWTPSLTNFTLGNGLSEGRYYKINNIVTVVVNIVWGSTTSASGVISISNLPFTSLSTSGGTLTPRWQSVAQYQDFGSAAYVGHVYVNPNSTNMSLRYSTTSNNQIANIDATNPFTWSSSDFICIIGSYETAF